MLTPPTPDLTCPVCERPIEPGGSANKHHFVPRSRGGRETTLIHRVCHSKIHSLFTEKELERRYSTPEALRAHPEVAKFIAWLQGKPPAFHDRSRKTRARARRRG